MVRLWLEVEQTDRQVGLFYLQYDSFLIIQPMNVRGTIFLYQKIVLFASVWVDHGGFLGSGNDCNILIEYVCKTV